MLSTHIPLGLGRMARSRSAANINPPVITGSTSGALSAYSTDSCAPSSFTRSAMVSLLGGGGREDGGEERERRCKASGGFRLCDTDRD